MSEVETATLRLRRLRGFQRELDRQKPTLPIGQWMVKPWLPDLVFEPCDDHRGPDLVVMVPPPPTPVLLERSTMPVGYETKRLVYFRYRWGYREARLYADPTDERLGLALGLFTALSNLLDWMWDNVPMPLDTTWRGKVGARCEDP